MLGKWHGANLVDAVSKASTNSSMVAKSFPQRCHLVLKVSASLNFEDFPCTTSTAKVQAL